MDIFTKHPNWPQVNKICDALFAEGHKAWLAGGCVRDGLLGILPKDFDIATDADPDEIEKLFPKTVGVGKSFGVIRVIMEGADIEVATFRTDGVYEDGRRPLSIKRATPEEDAARRDFTINALFYDIHGMKIYDYVGGQKDLKLRTIRTVGDPAKRFNEDYLRMMRAVRFVSQLNFKLDENTYSTIRKLAPLMAKVSVERIHDEMNKLFKGVRPDLGIKLLNDADLLKTLFPKWTAPIDAFLLKKLPHVPHPEMIGWLIFLVSSANEKRQDLYSHLKFSNEKKETLEGAIQNSELILKFKDLSLAQRKQLSTQKSIDLAIDFLDLQGKLLKPIKEFILTHKKIEPSLINAEDLKALGLKEGKDLGLLLKQAYELQLNEKFKSKVEMMEWARKNILKTQ